jgi:hypothetical protein
MKQNVVNSRSKTGKKTTLLPDLVNISQEKITNSDQLLTVIPISNNNKQEYSRVLLLKVKNELKSTVFSIYPEEDDKATDFSGKIMIRNLNGDFVNGFRVKNGYIISQYTKKNNKNITYRNTAEELDEVVIPPRQKLFNMNTAFLFPEDAYGGSTYGDNFWNPEYGYGGGGESTIFLNSPSFKFDPADNYNILYPKFIKTVSNIADYVNSNQKIMQTLQKYTGLNNVQILEKLKFGQGPTVKINQLGNNYGYHNPLTNTVQIDIDYVNKLENSLGSQGEILNLMLSITLLHEFVHWTDGLFFNYTQENGNNWEIATYGFVVNMGNITLMKP